VFKDFENFIPQTDAPGWAKLQETGAILVGKN